MAIAHKATGTVLEETGTTHEVSAPGTLDDGDFMLMVCTTHSGTGTAISNDEGDWTKLAVEAISSSGSDTVCAAFYKFASGEAGTYTVSHTNSLLFKGVIVTYTGVDITSPMDATPTKVENVLDSATHTPADITVATDQAMGIALIAKAGGSVGGTVPSGYTGRVTTGTGAFIGVAEQSGLSTGVHSPADWTDLGSAADSGSITALLRPASGTIIIVPTGPWR